MAGLFAGIKRHKCHEWQAHNHYQRTAVMASQGESAAVVCCCHMAPFHPLFHPPRAAPPEACGAANRWLGVVRGTKLVGKSHARALRRRFPAPRRFDSNVPVGAKWGVAVLRVYY
jgi:hypothetical protein